MPQKLTFEVFREKAIIKHNGRYRYDTQDYVNSHTKINITCLLHGDFQQTPGQHLSGKRVC